MVKLTPPPRAPAIRTPEGPGDGSTPSRFRTWGTAALFAALGVLATVVFVVLPGWVDRNPASSPSSPAAAAPTATVVENPIAEVQATDDRPSRSGNAEQATPREGRKTLDEPAADGVALDQERQTEASFGAAMSEGLAGLEAGDPAAAREAFERARSIRPSSPEVAEALWRADRLQRRQRIATLRDQAATAETLEDWRSSETAYAEVLTIDRHLAFAQEGLERSAARRELAEAIEFYIANPQRLASDEVLAEAEAVLERAQRAQPTGPRLEDQTARLAEVVEVAGTPVTVSLHSDNLTQVVIYTVGKLGTFARTTVELRPGTYTVVGSRPGFRDVRLEVTVRPGGPMPPVIIRCEDEV